MITVTQAIFDPSAQQELVAVVGFDISIDSIQKHIVDEVKFLEGGIVALVETEIRESSAGPNKDRYLVAHVDFDSLAAALPAGSEDPPFFGSAEPEISENATLLADLFSGNGSTEVLRAKDRSQTERTNYLLAHTTIEVPVGYTVLTIVPEEEALRPIASMTELISATEVSVSVSVLAITTATAILVLLLVRAVAGRIAKPVNKMVIVAQNIVSGAAEKDLAKNLGATHMKSLEKYAQVKDKDGKDVSDQEVRNEMISLVRSFLAMTQGLKKDSNRAKARVVQPKNKFYVREEHPLVSALQEVDEQYWGSSAGGGGAAPIPNYAMAIAEATPVPMSGVAGDGDVPIASVTPMVPPTKF